MNFKEILLSGITILPLAGVIILLLWRKASKNQAAIIGIISEGFALIIPIFLLSTLQSGETIQFSVAWIPNMNIAFTLKLDWLSLVFLVTEVLVTLGAMIYSLGEKTGEKK